MLARSSSEAAASCTPSCRPARKNDSTGTPARPGSPASHPSGTSRRPRRHLLEADARYRLDSAGEFDGRPDFLRIETTHLSPADVATQIIDHFGLAPERGRRP
jgi:hypothetical protein